MATPEGRIKVKLKRELDKLPLTWQFRPVLNGMGKPGLDIFLCVNGQFVAVETKAPGKNLTPRQQVTADEINSANGYVFVVSSDDDIENCICCLKELIGG